MATRPLCRLTCVTRPRTSHLGSFRSVCSVHAESLPPLHQSQTGWLRGAERFVDGAVAAILRCVLLLAVRATDAGRNRDLFRLGRAAQPGAPGLLADSRIRVAETRSLLAGLLLTASLA